MLFKKILFSFCFVNALYAEDFLKEFEVKNQVKVLSSKRMVESKLSELLPREFRLNSGLILFPKGYIKGKTVVEDAEVAYACEAIVFMKSIDELVVLRIFKFIEKEEIWFMLKPAVFVKLENGQFLLDGGQPTCGIFTGEQATITALIDKIPIDEMKAISKRAHWLPVNNRGQELGIKDQDYKPPLLINK